MSCRSKSEYSGKSLLSAVGSAGVWQAAHPVHEKHGQCAAPLTGYVNELPLKRAFMLLATRREVRVSDAALQAGFSDISHFNRPFRYRFGGTPSGVRSQASGALRAAWESHLARAKWMTEHGYRGLLRRGTPR
jgi:AraC-like DNA-binding protein